jgi:endonuclease/exonuclease/phosphatase family metal-dependent hydrolase
MHQIELNYGSFFAEGRNDPVEKQKKKQTTTMEDDEDKKDEDVCMQVANSLPSQVTDTQALYFPCHIPNAHGKWMMFVSRLNHDLLWTCVQSWIQTLQCVHVLFAKTNTFLPNSHASSDNQGVVMIYCAHAPENDLLDIGRLIAQTFEYTSEIGWLCYKTEEQSRNGSRASCASANQKQHTLKIPVPISRQHQTTLDSYFARQQQQPQFTDKQRATSQQIRTYSLNILHSSASVTERMLCVLQDIERQVPDVVMLQEVTQMSYDVLHDLLMSLGFTTRSVLKPETKRFSEMLYFNTKTLEALSFEQIPLLPECTMRRELHILRVQHRTSSIRLMFATAHLEQGVARKDLRERQYRWLQNILEQKQTPWIFGGDTNMAYYQNDVPLVDNVSDAWIELGRDDRTAGTWDPRKNTFLQKLTQQHVAQCRFDRFLFQRSSFRAKKFALSCQDVIAINENSNASDHFAIVADFDF